MIKNIDEFPGYKTLSNRVTSFLVFSDNYY